MTHTLKLKDTINGNYTSDMNDSEYDVCKKYNLTDIDNPNGWNFDEIDLLGNMGFIITNDTDMDIELDVPSLNLNETQDEKVHIKVFKTTEGYTLKTAKRKYVFETFDDMINFISK